MITDLNPHSNKTGLKINTHETKIMTNTGRRIQIVMNSTFRFTSFEHCLITCNDCIILNVRSFAALNKSGLLSLNSGEPFF